MNIQQQGWWGGVTVGHISQDANDDFRRQRARISCRSHQRSLNYTLEGHINNFIIEKVDKKLQLQEKVHSASTNVINCIVLPSLSPLKFRSLALMRKYENNRIALASLPRVSVLVWC